MVPACLEALRSKVSDHLFISFIMTAYLAKIVYQIICGEGNHTPQFDEQIRFVVACSKEAALEKSRLIGVQEEEVFYNQKQQLVRWKFIDVAELHVIKEIEDGAEIYSEIKEIEDAESYSRLIHHKATQLQKEFRSLTLQTA